MKKLLAATLLLASTQAFANIGAGTNGLQIQWPQTNGWMQVQNSSDYTTVCEGYINICTVLESGNYSIIDHSNSTRQDNVLVSPDLEFLPVTSTPAASTTCVTTTVTINGALAGSPSTVCY